MDRARRLEIPGQNQRKLKVAVATADASVRASLSEILDGFSVESIWLKSTDDVRQAFATNSIDCFLCGFWLENGTYREVVKHIKKQLSKVPFLMVSTPGSTNEYRDYLASLNVGAFDFICYPYQQTEVKRILQSAFAERQRSLLHEPAAAKFLPVASPENHLLAARSSSAVQVSPSPRAA